MQILKEEIKERILAAALSEFGEYGYSQSSMRRIASAAGMTTGNIYRYFENKDGLFQALLHSTYEKFMDYTLAIKTKIDSSFKPDALEAFSYIQMVDDTIVELLKDSSTEIRILLTLSQGSAYEQAKHDLILIVSQILERVLTIRKGTEVLKRMDQLSVEMFAASLVEGLSLILREHSDGDVIKHLVGELIFIYSAGFNEKLNR